jgi:flavin reductase (DIM6/NTAB) family NADH-FMN oxidoreductase RutF
VGAWRDTEEGLPYLTDAQANLFCEIDRISDYGTHTIFIGRVSSAVVHADVDPLLYQDGKYVIARPVSDDQIDRDVRAAV